MPIELHSGQRVAAARNGAFLEYFRVDEKHRLRDTHHALVDRRHVFARSEPRPAAPAGEQRGHPDSGPRGAPSERRPRSLRELFGL
jgi:hypothetical protein